MNDYLKKTLVFVLISLTAVVGFVFAIHFIMHVSYNFKLDKKYSYAVFGNSHPECAFNDNLIKDLKNLAKSGEGYFYTYNKIKEITSENDIETIFIEFSNNAIIPGMDDWIWGLEKMNAYFPVHSSFMDKSDIFYLYQKNRKDFFKAASTSTRNNLFRILALDLSIDYRYGSYSPIDREKIPELMEVEGFERNEEYETNSISEDNIIYLEKIIDYCNSKNIEVYLIRSPQHEFQSRANETQLMEIKKTRFANIPFLDFDRFPLEDNQYGDFGHINNKGAELFSKWFNHLIEKGLLGEQDKEHFVQRAIESMQTKSSNLQVQHMPEKTF